MDIKNFILHNNAYFEDFITRSTYHTNAIEGNTLSYAETYAILFNDNSLKITAEPREIYEAINHKYALSYLLSHIDEPLSEKLIKDIAIQINKNVNEISGYRTTQVFIQGAEHIPPLPNQINQTMMYFVYNYNKTEYESIFEKVAVNHIAVEQSHPFSDGNGRTGRLLINFELIRNNMPPIVIPKDERTLYFNFLADNNIKGLSAFIETLCNIEEKRINRFKQENLSTDNKSLLNEINNNKE